MARLNLSCPGERTDVAPIDSDQLSALETVQTFAREVAREKLAERRAGLDFEAREDIAADAVRAAMHTLAAWFNGESHGRGSWRQIVYGAICKYVDGRRDGRRDDDSDGGVADTSSTPRDGRGGGGGAAAVWGEVGGMPFDDALKVALAVAFKQLSGLDHHHREELAWYAAYEGLCRAHRTWEPQRGASSPRGWLVQNVRWQARDQLRRLTCRGRLVLLVESPDDRAADDPRPYEAIDWKLFGDWLRVQSREWLAPAEYAALCGRLDGTGPGPDGERQAFSTATRKLRLAFAEEGITFAELMSA